MVDFWRDLGSDFYSESAFLSAEDVVRQKSSRKQYNFNGLPPLAIVVLDRKLPKMVTGILAKKLKGLPGEAYFLDKESVVCAPFGNGAPAALLLLEELRVLGVQKFVFIGTAGILDEQLSQKPFLISHALSGVGSSISYSSNEVLRPVDELWTGHLAQQLGLEKASAWSTDCPYRETPSILQNLKRKAVQLVDMECAAVYAFAEFYSLKAACFLIGADVLNNEKWQAPANMPALITSQKKLISSLRTLKSM